MCDSGSSLARQCRQIRFDVRGQHVTICQRSLLKTSPLLLVASHVCTSAQGQAAFPCKRIDDVEQRAEVNVNLFWSGTLEEDLSSLDLDESLAVTSAGISDSGATVMGMSRASNLTSPEAGDFIVGVDLVGSDNINTSEIDQFLTGETIASGHGEYQVLDDGTSDTCGVLETQIHIILNGGGVQDASADFTVRCGNSEVTIHGNTATGFEAECYLENANGLPTLLDSTVTSRGVNLHFVATESICEGDTFMILASGNLDAGVMFFPPFAFGGTDLRGSSVSASASVRRA